MQRMFRKVDTVFLEHGLHEGGMGKEAGKAARAR